MSNVKVEVKGKQVVITCDISGKGEPSASGKSIVLASTRGNMALEGGLFLGLNLYRKAQ